MGTAAVDALNGGYHVAFLVGAAFALVATLIGLGIAAGRPAPDGALRPAAAHE